MLVLSNCTISLYDLMGGFNAYCWPLYFSFLIFISLIILRIASNFKKLSREGFLLKITNNWVLISIISFLISSCILKIGVQNQNENNWNESESKIYAFLRKQKDGMCPESVICNEFSIDSVCLHEIILNSKKRNIVRYNGNIIITDLLK